MNEFNYTRDWTHQEDFPTVEQSEAKVRYDLQYQPNEIKDFLNYLVRLLTSQNGAAEIGVSVSGEDATTVQGAVDDIRNTLSRLNVDDLDGMSKADIISTTGSDTEFPTSAAVRAAIDAIVLQGGGDMLRSVYDTAGKNEDVFSYADQVAQEAVSGISKSDVGLGNVDNTSDADKPISTAMRMALNDKVNTADTIQVKRGGTGATTAAAARANLGLSKKDIVNIIYPVGSIYVSVSSTSPVTLFGGTWVRIKDRFLLSAGDTYAPGTTGGEAEHKLTVSEMPSHNHDIALQQSGGPVASGVIRQASGEVSDGLYVRHRGGDKAHNNMPPYLAVYVWKRTA